MKIDNLINLSHLKSQIRRGLLSSHASATHLDIGFSLSSGNKYAELWTKFFRYLGKKFYMINILGVGSYNFFLLLALNVLYSFFVVYVFKKDYLVEGLKINLYGDEGFDLIVDSNFILFIPIVNFVFLVLFFVIAVLNFDRYIKFLFDFMYFYLLCITMVLIVCLNRYFLFVV